MDLKDLGHCLKEAIVDQSMLFLLECLSVAMQQGDAAAVLGSLKGSTGLVSDGLWASEWVIVYVNSSVIL